VPKTQALDKPEPRWQAILALIAVGGIYTALPSELSVGPSWLLLTIVLVLLVPSVLAHRTGRHSLNHRLGIITNSVITTALVVSLALLIGGLPSHKEGRVLSDRYARSCGVGQGVKYGAESDFHCDRRDPGLPSRRCALARHWGMERSGDCLP
jgi:hypothetical protein